MSTRLLLYVTAESLLALTVNRGNCIAQREFPATPVGRSEFDSFLQDTPGPALLLADLVEEDFRAETVPHVNGRRHAALVQRKYAQFYPDTPFRLATLQQREPGGRRDDIMLFAALTNPALLNPWLDLLRARQIPLAGIYSVPHLSTALIENRAPAHLLLLSWEKHAGLRQTFFSNRRLQLSRLTPLRAGVTFSAAVADELVHTRHYLQSVSLLPTGHLLTVRFLCHANDRAALEAAGGTAGADVRTEFSDLNALAGRCRIAHRFPDSDASLLFLQQLAAAQPQANYANAAQRHYHQLWQLRRGLNWSGATLLLASGAWAAANVWQAHDNIDATALITRQTQQLRNEIAQVAPSLPAAAPAADMKAGVNIMRRLELTAAPPVAILQPISALLDRYPQVELGELSWQNPAAASPAADADGSSRLRAIVLRGSLTGFGADYRAALNYLARFRNDLAAHGYRVTMLEQPLNLDPDGSIADSKTTQPDAFGFALQLAQPVVR